jgi:4-amino-4-deoxy-L-arabinose transferase-like glycosyltransferase
MLPSERENAAGSRRHLLWLGLILAAGVAVRLLLWGHFQGRPLSIGDELDYHHLGESLSQTGEFALPKYGLTSLRPPLFPFIVAGLYRLFGAGNFDAVRLALAGLSLILPILVYSLASDLYGRREGLCAAAIGAFYPSLLGFNNLVLTEIPFTLLLALFVWTVHRGVRGGGIGWLVLAGAVLGLGALTRSVLWLFPPILALYLLWAWRGRPGGPRPEFPKRVAAALVPAIVFAAAITPWTIRNTRLQKTFTTIDSMSGRNVMMGNYEYTPMFRAWDAISIKGKEAWFRVLAERYPEYDNLTQGQADKLAMKEAVRFVRAHPGLTFRRDVVKFFAFWQLERELIAGVVNENFGRFPTWAVLALAALVFGSYVFCLVTGIFGFAVSPPADRRTDVLIFLMTAFICGLHVLSFGHSRYHLPLMPLVGVYAPAAFLHLRSVWGRRNEWSFRAAALVSLTLAGWWLFEVVAVDSARMGKVFTPS